MVMFFALTTLKNIPLIVLLLKISHLKLYNPIRFWWDFHSYQQSKKFHGRKHQMGFSAMGL
jgi:hypothetical protein